MLDWFWFGLKWLLIAAAISPIVLGIGSVIVEGSILPRLIASEEIERLAEEFMRQHPGNPEKAVFIEEHAAWHRSRTYEQGKWRRVRKAIRRRLVAGEQTSA